MTTDDIIKLARESQRENLTSAGGYWFQMEVNDLERFAHLIRAAALEEAEAECEKRLHWGDYGATACRNAIRQLKEQAK